MKVVTLDKIEEILFWAKDQGHINDDQMNLLLSNFEDAVEDK